MSIYFINAKFDLEKDEYRLFNHDFPAGDRLIKHNPESFPLDTSKDWTRYKDETEAEEAAAALQNYLDKKPQAAPRKNGQKKKRKS